MTTKEKGDLGEEAVCNYLTERGYSILGRNFRVRGGEIDIIASRGEDLCFVEVKTRKAGSLESGFEAVDKRKERLMIRAAYLYCEKFGINDEEWYIRYDIAAVTLLQGRVTEIEYVENAFDESGLRTIF